jgi:hypothetical protein
MDHIIRTGLKVLSDLWSAGHRDLLRTTQDRIWMKDTKTQKKLVRTHRGIILY